MRTRPATGTWQFMLTWRVNGLGTASRLRVSGRRGVGGSKTAELASYQDWADAIYAAEEGSVAEVVEAVKNIVETYAANARKHERMGEWIDRIGWPMERDTLARLIAGLAEVAA